MFWTKYFTRTFLFFSAFFFFNFYDVRAETEAEIDCTASVVNIVSFKLTSDFYFKFLTKCFNQSERISIPERKVCERRGAGIDPKTFFFEGGDYEHDNLW